MRSKKNGGFTLIEGLFSIFMTFLILGALTQTLNQAAGVKKNTKNMDRAIEEFHALLTMKKDATAALSVSAPSKGSSGSSLTLTRIDPSKDFLVRTDVLNNPNDPFEAAESVTIRYQIDSGVLKRFVTRPSESPTAERLIEAKTFRAELSSSTPPLLTLTLEIEGTRVTETRVLKVALNS